MTLKANDLPHAEFLDLTSLSGGGTGPERLKCRWCDASVKATYLKRHTKTKGCTRKQRQRDASRLRHEAVELNYSEFDSRNIASLFRLLDIPVIEVPPPPRKRWGTEYHGPEWAVALATQADMVLGDSDAWLIERLITHGRDNTEFRNTVISLIRMSGVDALQAYAKTGSMLCSKGATCDAETRTTILGEPDRWGDRKATGAEWSTKCADDGVGERDWTEELRLRDEGLKGAS